MFITADYLDAEASYRNGGLVYEYRKVRYSTEWTTVEHTIGYTNGTAIKQKVKAKGKKMIQVSAETQTAGKNF